MHYRKIPKKKLRKRLDTTNSHHTAHFFRFGSKAHTCNWNPSKNVKFDPSNHITRLTVSILASTRWRQLVFHISQSRIWTFSIYAKCQKLSASIVFFSFMFLANADWQRVHMNWVRLSSFDLFHEFISFICNHFWMFFWFMSLFRRTNSCDHLFSFRRKNVQTYYIHSSDSINRMCCACIQL